MQISTDSGVFFGYELFFLCAENRGDQPRFLSVYQTTCKTTLAKKSTILWKSASKDEKETQKSTSFQPLLEKYEALFWIGLSWRGFISTEERLPPSSTPQWRPTMPCHSTALVLTRWRHRLQRGWRWQMWDKGVTWHPPATDQTAQKRSDRNRVFLEKGDFHKSYVYIFTQAYVIRWMQNAEQD